jgi:hypothetical protein
MVRRMRGPRRRVRTNGQRAHRRVGVSVIRHPGTVLDVTFVRRRSRRDRVYVTRSDGTSIEWDFPSYGDGLPHDLCHLVVEDELGLVDGFWGLVDQGVGIVLIDNAATLMRNGRPLAAEVGIDLSELVEAEHAVAVLAGTLVAVEYLRHRSGTQPPSPVHPADEPGRIADALGFELPASATPEAIAAVRARLRDLAHRWRSLEDGAAITLTFARRPI